MMSKKPQNIPKQDSVFLLEDRLVSFWGSYNRQVRAVSFKECNPLQSKPFSVMTRI